MQHVTATLFVARIFSEADFDSGELDAQTLALVYADDLINFLIANGLNPACLAIRLGLNDPKALDWDFLRTQFAAALLHLYQKGQNIGRGVHHEN